MNSKDLAEKKEDESSDPPAWQHRTAHLSVYKGRNCSNGPDYSPSFSLQSWFSTLWLLCSYPPEGGTQRTLLQRTSWSTVCVRACVCVCARARVCVCVYTYRQSSVQLTYSIWCKVGKSLLIMKESLWKNNLKFVKDVNFVVIVIIVSEKKYKTLLLYHMAYFCICKCGKWLRWSHIAVAVQNASSIVHINSVAFSEHSCA